MAYKLNDINLRTVSDHKAFMQECDAIYDRRVEEAVERILANKKNSPIVLLSGPSGSGKTTTSMKIAEAMEKHGVYTHYVGMDDYFKTVDRTTPRTPEGELDLESPLCLDMELLNRHFSELARGERIYVPKYEFARQMRVLEPSKSLRLHADEVAARRATYVSRDVYRNDPEIKAAIDMIRQNVFSLLDPGLFDPIVRNLLDYNDYYMLLADLRSYSDAQDRVDAAYRDAKGWNRMSLVNIARSGHFSSDRAVKEYCENIWHVKPVQFGFTS